MRCGAGSRSSIAKELRAVEPAIGPAAVALLGVAAAGAHELGLVVHRAGDPPRLVARLALGGDAVVAADLVRLALDGAARGAAARRGRRQRARVADEHRLVVLGARVRPALAAGVALLAERRVAADVAHVADEAALRPAAGAPEGEAARGAGQRARPVGRARVVDRGISRAGLALGGDPVVSVVGPPPVRPAPVAPARDPG